MGGGGRGKGKRHGEKEEELHTSSFSTIPFKRSSAVSMVTASKASKES